MAKGDAAKSAQKAEQISEEFRMSFSTEFYECIKGEDSDVLFKAIENILADAACLLSEDIRLTTLLSVLNDAAHKSIQVKRYKKMIEFYRVMQREGLN